jgi:hypothetical protein
MSATITRSHPDPAHADNVHQIDEVEVLLQSVIRRAADAANNVWTKPKVTGVKFTAGPRMAALANSRPSSAPVSSGNVMQGKLSCGRRAFRATTRFVISALVGVVATLAWQSYGDAAKQELATRFPQLPSWTSIRTDRTPHQITLEGSALPATPSDSTSVEPIAPVKTTIASAASAADRELLEILGSNVAAVRQQLEQFAAKQEQMVQDVANLQSADQEMNRKVERLLLLGHTERPEHRRTPPLPPLRTLPRPSSGSVAGTLGPLH